MSIRNGVFLCWVCFCWTFSTVNTETTIEKLFNKIKDAQVQQDTEFKLFPPSWELKKGMYPNEVKLNFHGDEQYYFFRDNFKVPDNNMFTPAWVTSCLLEAYIYGNAPRPTTEQMNLALNAIDLFRNQNAPYKNSEMTFWQQKLNKTAQTYQSSPSNLFKVLAFPDYLPQELIEKILEMFGLKDLEVILEKLFKAKDMFLQAFHIPPDFDDTFVNIGLGSLLTKFHEDFPTELQTWQKQNGNLTSVFEKVKRYAYRPFSKTSSQATIDPRTYMYLRTFLEEADAKHEDVALVTTWLQDTVEVHTMFDKGVDMPFNVNNVDITVSANFVFGIVMCTVTGLCDEHIDDDIQQIFMNTTSLIAHELATNLSSRPDLALTYYPSKYEFYWFVSRSYSYLNRMYMTGRGQVGIKNQDEMLKFAYKVLQPVLRQQMSEDIINSAKTDDSDGSKFIDDFLGNNDINFFNETVNRAEDRIFTTAVSLNALINTWTLSQGKHLVWEKDTPDVVRDTVGKLALWLDRNVLSGKYKPWNSFFSGSGKSLKSMPFFYPANRREYFNGTTFSDKKFPSSAKNIIGMNGIVSHDEYATMLKQPHFGMMTPMTFDGYNSEAGGYFPLWSCDSYTYAVSLLALSQYDNIENK